MKLYQRKYRVDSTRLKEWDYSASGYYFVTICTRGMKNWLGKVVEEEVKLSEIGTIAQGYWLEIPTHFVKVKLDEFVIMPNHVHGIIVLHNNGVDYSSVVKTMGRGRDKAMPCLYENDGSKRFQNQGRGSLSAIIGSYKSIVTKTVHRELRIDDFAWQPRFYDHIIRNHDALDNIRKYIRYNPLKWQADDNFVS